MSDNPHNPEWVAYEPDVEAYDAGMPRRGQRVRVRGSWAGMEARGLHDGHGGTVVGHARGKEADRKFHENKDAALRAGRGLTGDDYEPLIDSEGPLVHWDGDEQPDWVPGQAMAVLAYEDYGVQSVAAAVESFVRNQLGAEVSMFEPEPNGNGWIIGAKMGEMPLIITVNETP